MTTEITVKSIAQQLIRHHGWDALPYSDERAELHLGRTANGTPIKTVSLGLDGSILVFEGYGIGQAGLPAGTLNQSAHCLPLEAERIDALARFAASTVTTPHEFIADAYAAVRKLTDESDQFHRRAVIGKRMVPFVSAHGVVKMRVAGQYLERGFGWYPTDPYAHIRRSDPQEPRTIGNAFAFEVQKLLADMPAPVL